MSNKAPYAGKYRWILALITLMSPAYSTAADTNNLPELVFNSATEEPLSNAHNTGFLDVLLSEAVRHIGYQLVRVQLPAERALRDVNKGKLDGEYIRVDGMENKYTNLVRVNEKIMDLDFVAFSHQSLELKDGWAALEPYNVSFLSGWKIIEANIPKDTRINKVSSPQQLFHMLYKRRTEVIVYERWAGLNILTNDPNYRDIRVHMPPLATSHMYCYLNKKHADLAEKLAQAIAELKANGTYTKLYRTHLHYLSE